MPTTETPFLTFWRALDAELALIGESPATQAQAVHWLCSNHGVADCARTEKRSRQDDAARQILRIRQAAINTAPQHQRGAGKDFTP